MALGRESTMCCLECGCGALPSLRLETAVLAQAELDALAEAAEEGGFVGRRPAEPGGSSVAIDARANVGVESVDVVFRHGASVADRSYTWSRAIVAVYNGV